jgi:uncharacterized surface protein with fasciclin (FAS1) repeats
MKMNKKIQLFIILLIPFFTYQCEKFLGPEKNNSAGFFNEEVVSISKYIINNPESFSKFQAILEESKMIDALDSYNPEGNNFTLFLPNNAAIDNFVSHSENYTNFEDLLADTEFTTALARYHIVMQEFKTLDFPFGALPETTASNDFLTISYVFGYDYVNNITLYDSTIYKVNGVASIINENVELINGIVQVIDQMLIPVTQSSYEWLKGTEGFDIITQAFELTGLSDTMGLFRTNAEGMIIENAYTLLIEHDSIYHKNNIFNIDDLINLIVNDPLKTNYTNPDNPLYQFAAYHILENRYFLDGIDVEYTNYNTFANYPVNMKSSLDIMVNKGSFDYDTLIVSNDTTYIDYIKVLYTVSNVLTKNGAIHFLNHVMRVYKPKPSRQTFQFLNEEPVLNDLRNEIGDHPFFNDDEFIAIKWEGAEMLEYIKSASSTELANNLDYIRIEGDFYLRYTIPKLLAGNYTVKLKANAQNNQNATIQVFIDGKRIGSSFNLGSGGNPYSTINLGKITFLTSNPHVIEIRTLIPGKFEWDFIQFDPS